LLAGKGRMRVAMAVANKMARIIWAMMTKQANDRILAPPAARSRIADLDPIR